MRKGTFIRTTRLVAAAVAGVVVSSTAASALVLEDKSEAQKLRADIQKQQHGFVACLVKAATNCEKSGLLVASECNLATGIASGDADAKGKFATDIAKCESKLNFLKKAKTLDASTGYTGIGCPGDSNSGTPAVDEPYVDMTAWQASTPAATRSQINTLAVALGGLTECGMQPDVKSQQKCQNAEVKRIASYAFAIQKCQLACENDYKNKKGNNGDFDTTTACSLNAGAIAGVGDGNFNACIDKAYQKVIKNSPIPPNVTAIVMPALSTALNDANNDLNNENDCP